MYNTSKRGSTQWLFGSADNSKISNILSCPSFQLPSSSIPCQKSGLSPTCLSNAKPALLIFHFITANKKTLTM